jgi:thiamine biosynthesis lipoprotein
MKLNQTRFMLGTQVSVTLLAKDRRAGLARIEKIFDEIGRLEKIYSDRRQDSELVLINDLARKGWIQVSPEMAEILNDAFYWHNRTNGLFDITVGALGRTWGFKTRGSENVPDSKNLEKLTAGIGMHKVEWDQAKSRIRFRSPEILLDLGGIAKLAILRKLDIYLRREKCFEYLINLGGDVLVGQRRGRKWRVGISDPKHPANTIFQLELKDSLVLTSGDYFRGFSQDGKLFHHIFNPKTGFPLAWKVPWPKMGNGIFHQDFVNWKHIRKQQAGKKKY